MKTCVTHRLFHFSAPRHPPGGGPNKKGGLFQALNTGKRKKWNEGMEIQDLDLPQCSRLRC